MFFVWFFFLVSSSVHGPSLWKICRLWHIDPEQSPPTYQAGPSPAQRSRRALAHSQQGGEGGSKLRVLDNGAVAPDGGSLQTLAYRPAAAGAQGHWRIVNAPEHSHSGRGDSPVPHLVLSSRALPPRCSWISKHGRPWRSRSGAVGGRTKALRSLTNLVDVRYDG